MKEKTILITGASTGIGYYCASQLKIRGYQVFTTARKPEDIARLNNEGLTCFYLDYRQEASIESCFQNVMAKTNNKLDILFNNGAYGLLGAVEDIKTDDLREQFEANFFGWHSLSKRIIPIMRQNGHGRIIQCSSVLGIVSGMHRAPYAATKHALEAFNTSMRIELAAHNIHVVSIRPGPIQSEFLNTALKTLQEKIDLNKSAHKKDYQKSLERLNKGNKSSFFKLGPEAVFKKLLRACETKRPKAVYSVTTLTYIVDMIRRLLPTRLAEKIIAKG